MPEAMLVKELAKLLEASHTGDPEVAISGVATLENAGGKDITWAAGKKYAVKVQASQAGAVIVGKDFGPTPMPAILVEEPELAILSVLEHFAPPPAHPAAGVHATAVVAETAKVDPSVAVGANAFIGEDVSIGKNTVVYPNVYVGAESVIGESCILYAGVVIRERCRLGNRVILQPNVTVGGDGFGYQLHDGKHKKIPQIGTVVIEDDVEVGAGSCIDRAKVGQTRIGQGVKIDNLVQVAHNVDVGPYSLLIAQVGIAGSAKLGRYVVLGGQVGVRDHVTIGDQVQTAACSCISKDVPAGQVLMGIPAYDAKTFFKDQAALRRLERYVKQIRDLGDRIKRLESATND